MSPRSKSQHTPSISGSHCQLLSWGHQPRAGLGITASKSINLIIACVPGQVERGCSKENKHATAAGGTSAQLVPGLARRLCLFPFPPTHTQITNLPAPCSANASFCKQKLDAPEGLTGLIQVDVCEETPPFLPIPGEKQWQQQPQVKPAMGCSVQDPELSPTQHIFQGDRNRAAWCT